MCQLEASKYTCPVCEVRSCSLACVKAHKERSGCSGVLDGTRFIAKSSITGNDVNRDYNFLLNVGRQLTVGKEDVKQSARGIFKRNFRANGGQNAKRQRQSNVVDPRLFLVNKAYPQEPTTVIKGKNTLAIQVPVGMGRAAMNKTGYDKKIGSFVWTVEWVFIDIEGSEKSRFVSFRLKESLALKDAIPTNVLEKLEEAVTIDKDELKFYLDNVVDRKRRAKKKPSLIPVSGESSISEALRDMVVFEFPTIYVCNCEISKDLVCNGLQDVSDESSVDSSSSEDNSSSSDSSSSGDSDSESDSDSSEDENEIESEIVEGGINQELIGKTEDRSEKMMTTVQAQPLTTPAPKVEAQLERSKSPLDPLNGYSSSDDEPPEEDSSKMEPKETQKMPIAQSQVPDTFELDGVSA